MKSQDILLIGPGRTATTSLFNFLGKFDEILLSEKKELGYYLPNFLKNSSQHTIKPNNANQYKYFVDATPLYFCCGELIAKKIYRENPETKIIVTLRNPIERLYSLYQHTISKNIYNQNYTFEEYIHDCKKIKQLTELTEKNIYLIGLIEGQYSIHLEYWFEHFSQHNVLVLFFENLNYKPKTELEKLLTFLQIDTEDTALNKFIKTNSATKYKNRTLHKLANSFNNRFETFLRKYSNFKSILKNSYNYLNLDPIRIVIPLEIESYLRDYYAESNNQLFNTLRLCNYNDIPRWQ